MAKSSANPQPRRSLSEVAFGSFAPLFKGILDSYKAGGITLAFLAAGALLLVASMVGTIWSNAGYIVAAVGCLLIVYSLLLAEKEERIARIRDTDRLFKENRELLDTVQSIAEELTDISNGLHDVVLDYVGDVIEYSSKVECGHNQLRPLLDKLSLIPGASAVVGTLESLLASTAVAQALAVSRKINETNETTREVIAKVKTSIITVDADGLNEYVSSLKELNQRIAMWRRAPPRPAEPTDARVDLNRP